MHLWSFWQTSHVLSCDSRLHPFDVQEPSKKHNAPKFTTEPKSEPKSEPKQETGPNTLQGHSSCIPDSCKAQQSPLQLHDIWHIVKITVNGLNRKQHLNCIWKPSDYRHGFGLNTFNHQATMTDNAQAEAKP